MRRRSVAEVAPRHEDAEKDTLPPVFFRRCNHVTLVLGPYRGPKVDNAFQALDSGPQRAGKCDVPGAFVNDRASRAPLSGRTVTEVRLRNVPAPTSPRTPHVPGVSWRPQPARAATRRPGRISAARPPPSHPLRGRSAQRAEVRLKGVEPSRALAHTDLNRARLPVPPQPRDLPIYRSAPLNRSVTHATPVLCPAR